MVGIISEISEKTIKENDKLNEEELAIIKQKEMEVDEEPEVMRLSLSVIKNNQTPKKQILRHHQVLAGDDELPSSPIKITL